MRTNIDIEKELLEEAFKFTDIKTKKDLINLALKEFVETHKRKNLLELKGKIKFSEDYDYKRMREGK